MRKMCTLLILCPFLYSGAAGRQTSYGGTFRINAYQQDEQSDPALGPIDGGGCVVAWHSDGQERNGGYSWGVFGQVLNREGEKTGEEFQVNTYEEGAQTNPIVFSFPGGDFFIGWESDRDSDINPAVVGQFFTSDGEKSGNELLISRSNYHRKKNLSGCRLRDGRIVLFWESIDQEGPSWGIFGQILSPGGEKTGGEFRINTMLDGDQFNPRMTALQNGGFVACWQDVTYEDWYSKENAYFQIFASNGDKIGSETPFYQGSIARENKFTISGLDSGPFVIAWESINDDLDIVAKLYAADGSKISDRFLVNTNVDGPQANPAVAPLKHGQFLICWQNLNFYWEGKSICAQKFSPDGRPIDVEFLITDTARLPDKGPHNAPLKDGELLIFWEEKDLDNDRMTVFGQRVSSEGGKIQRNFEICVYPHTYYPPPKIAPFSEEGFLCCWSGYDGSNLGIYGRIMPYSTPYHALNPFHLIEPLNDQTVTNDTILFAWHPSAAGFKCYPWEITYDLIIGTDPDYSDPLIINDLVDTCFSAVFLKPGCTYFWKVMARNSADETLFSEPPDYGFYFPGGHPADSNASILADFSLIYPTDEIRLASTDVTLKWHKANKGKFYYPPDVYYSVYLDILPGFGTPVIHEGVMDTSWTVKELKEGSIYNWKVLAKKMDGDSIWCSQPAVFSIISERKLPKTHELYLNYPNPFNVFTTVNYILASDAHVTINIFGIRGEQVREIVNGQRPAGPYSFQWDGRNQAGKPASSGIYICRMEARSPDGPTFSKSMKMGLVR